MIWNLKKTVSKSSSETQLQSDVPTLPTKHFHSLASTHQNSIQQTTSDIQPRNKYLRLPRVAKPLHQVNPVTTLSQALQADADLSHAAPATLLAQQTDTHAIHFPSVGVLPGINVLRQNQNISQSVVQVLASSQGNASTKNSGRYNTTETVVSAPALRWPNEGYYSMQGKKHSTYNELSIPKWGSSPTSFTYNIQTPLRKLYCRPYWHFRTQPPFLGQRSGQHMAHLCTR